MRRVTDAIEHDGFAIVEGVVSAAFADRLIAAVGTVDAEHTATVQRRGSIHAVRNLLEAVPGVQQLARSQDVRALAEAVLGTDCFVVRGILFDKTPDANWKVSWHQDLTIAVREQRDVPGFGPWSEKAETVHVQPPTEVLEQMVTVRVHLDECGLDNGPVR